MEKEKTYGVALGTVRQSTQQEFALVKFDSKVDPIFKAAD